MAKTTKSNSKLALEAYENFIMLCKYFFSGNGTGKFADIPADNPFYKKAKEIAKEEGIDWNDMSDEDNDYLTIILLEEAYCAIRQDGEKDYKISITIEEIGKDEQEKDNEHPSPAD